MGVLIPSSVRKAARWRRPLGLSLFLVPACVGLRGQAPAEPAKTGAVATEARYRKEYVATPGDHLDIVVRRVPEATRSVTVRADGRITLPLINDVAVRGLTTNEIDAKLTSLLSKRLVDPEVTVIAAQVHEPTIYVGGEVNMAGAVPLRNAVTAVQAISLAGGLKRSAAARSIVIIRLGEDGAIETLPVVTTGHSQHGPYEALAQTPLFEDDIVFVPESGRSQLTRFIDDFINRPLQGVNAILGTYVNFKLIKIISREDQ
jgi:protein involved in polysaccharide export with SLBB domain